MRTLTQYEVAWNMHRAGSTMKQITQVVNKHRATVYRWYKRIRQLGIREFVRRQVTAKYRRPGPGHLSMSSSGLLTSVISTVGAVRRYAKSLGRGMAYA